MDEGVDTRDGGVPAWTLGAPSPGRPGGPPPVVVGPVLTLLTAATRLDKPGKATCCLSPPPPPPPAAFAGRAFVPHSRFVMRSSSFWAAPSSVRCHLSNSCPPGGLARHQNLAVKSFDPEQRIWPRGWKEREKTASSWAAARVVIGVDGVGERREK